MQYTELNKYAPNYALNFAYNAGIILSYYAQNYAGIIGQGL